MNTQTRKLTIIAQDPSFRDAEGRVVTAQVDVPAEKLWPGPMGYRVHVIDYDASTDTLYKARKKKVNTDHFAAVVQWDSELLIQDPVFHQQNVYAIVMATLGRFEKALGRRVSWHFHHKSHQLKIAPHAFAEPNAFYSRDDEALLFGYFRGATSGEIVFSCLSHDVVVHETTHAILDGMRERFTYLSSPDQAAFHEGFSDIVAIFSVFCLPEVLEVVYQHPIATQDQIEPAALRKSALLQVAEQMGQEIDAIRGSALRSSAELDPESVDLNSAEFLEPHRRGEVLVAAMLRSFVKIWSRRLKKLSPGEVPPDRKHVIDEGTKVASRLLTAAIRAIDFTPPVDLKFGDFLSALLTADLDVNPDDRHLLRETLTYVFREYGIEPASQTSKLGPGMWEPVNLKLRYKGLHLPALQHDTNEVFRFIWENRNRLNIYPTYANVQSVRPSLRVGEDGLVVRDTIAEYIQVLTLRAKELKSFDLQQPSKCPDDQEVKLYGGGALVFDEFGKLRLHIQNRLDSPRQQARLNYVWETTGTLCEEGSCSLAEINASLAAGGRGRDRREQW